VIPVVEVDAVLRAGEFTVTADVTLLPEHGPVTALFGPSGAGKSLTLALLAGLLRPDTGRVALGGRPVADAATGLHVRTQDRRVGMVFQEALLLPHRTAVDNVALAVRSGSRNERRTRALSELERVGAAELADAAPRTLSGGERQRVALARALAGDPQLLLLDEPLSALDAPTRVRLRTLLRETVTERDLPTLLVSHDLDEVRALADSVLLFEPGRTLGLHSVADLPQMAGDTPAGSAIRGRSSGSGG
jgi:molybdate transport system ATP-binding protein